jgi:hypothetical protein
VGPRAGLDKEARGKILCPCRGSNPDRPVVQPVVRPMTALNLNSSQRRTVANFSRHRQFNAMKFEFAPRHLLSRSDSKIGTTRYGSAVHIVRCR